MLHPILERKISRDRVQRSRGYGIQRPPEPVDPLMTDKRLQAGIKIFVCCPRFVQNIVAESWLRNSRLQNQKKIRELWPAAFHLRSTDIQVIGKIGPEFERLSLRLGEKSLPPAAAQDYVKSLKNRSRGSEPA
jgi:hypothetical protein